MPLDKMPNSEEFIPTHKSAVLHQKGNPIACIIDDLDPSLYKSLENNHSLRASLTGFLNKDEEFGLLFGFQLKIKTDDIFLQFTVYPDDELIDAVIYGERICIINRNLDPVFVLNVTTDQFVKTKSEFDKFKKTMQTSKHFISGDF